MLQIIEQVEGAQKSYRFAEGHRGERGNPVTEANLRIAVGLQGGKLSNKGEDLPLDNILFTLKENQRTLDSSLTIRHIIGEPLLNLRCGHIGSLVLAHLEVCEKQRLNPESSVIHLMHTPEMGQKMAMKIDKKMAVVPDNELGSINMYDGNQVVFSYHEWHLLPSSERTLSVRKNLQVVPTFAKTIKDLCINNMLVVDGGRLMRDGLSNLWIANMEIDRVIEKVDLDGFPPTKLDDQNDTPMEGAGA